MVMDSICEGTGSALVNHLVYDGRQAEKMSQSPAPNLINSFCQDESGDVNFLHNGTLLDEGGWFVHLGWF